MINSLLTKVPELVLLAVKSKGGRTSPAALKDVLEPYSRRGTLLNDDFLCKIAKFSDVIFSLPIYPSKDRGNAPKRQ
jgi:hypothetical protein